MGDFNRDRRAGGRRFGGGGRDFNRGPKEMFHAVCDNCGKDCEVPFKPTGNKPVYCSDCFSKMGGRSNSQGNRGSGGRQDNGSDLSEINAKLDRILSLLNPGAVSQPEPEVVVPEKKKRSPKKQAAPAPEIVLVESPVVEETPIAEEAPAPAPEETPTK